jgi:hypothetical protein
MDKNTRAEALIGILLSEGWNNSQFWEANQLLRSTPDREMTRPLINLLGLWGDVEGDRIACGEHEGPNPELEMYLDALWPVQSTGA